MTELERLEKANEFIKSIAGCGRKFFCHKGFIASFELSETKRVFYIDEYTKKRIYTHRRDVRWRHFTGGGTLKRLIESLRDYIKKGETLNLSYFQHTMSNGFENPWGYGEDIKIVHEAAKRLGIAK